jgi:CHASE3 domain sensor protein
MSHFSHRFRISLRVQGLVYNSLPLVAVLLSAGFAFFSNQQRERTELSLNRHFEMVQTLNEIHTALLGASAGLRGHLLTHDPKFLEPYTNAKEIIPQKLTRVRELMASIPKPDRRAQKLAKLDAAQQSITTELNALTSLVSAAAPLPGEDAAARVQENEPLLLAAGQQLRDLRANEERLLSRRIEEIRSARQRDYTLIFLSVLIGLICRAVALYFFHRRVVRRVRQLTENVRSLRGGAVLVHAPSGDTDDIGELERELARVSEFIAERRLGS